MEIQLLNDIVIIFGLSVAILLLCHRLGIPALVGFIVTGALAGPHGLGLVQSPHDVEILAEIGVVLLLFTIGIEFSFKRLLEIRKAVLLGGSLQVAFTTAGVYAGARALDLPPSEALFFGFLFSLSSTAIVLRLLQQKGEIDSPHGRTSLGILVFQDIVIVPMMLLTPLLAGEVGNINEFLLTSAAKTTGVLVVVIAGAKWLVPRLLRQSPGSHRAPGSRSLWAPSWPASLFRNRSTATTPSATSSPSGTSLRVSSSSPSGCSSTRSSSSGSPA
jgi:CPA2 family monovalent cation:H+ antiporter-2